MVPLDGAGPGTASAAASGRVCPWQQWAISVFATARSSMVVAPAACEPHDREHDSPYIPLLGIVSRWTAMHDATKAAVVSRLKRIEGQVGGLLRMVDEDRYCVDVLTQINAVRAA